MLAMVPTRCRLRCTRRLPLAPTSRCSPYSRSTPTLTRIARGAGSSVHVGDGIGDEFRAVEREVVVLTVDHIELGRVSAGPLEGGGDAVGGGDGVVRADEESDRCAGGGKIVIETMVDNDALEGP